MINSADQIARALEGTALDGRPVNSLEVPTLDDVAFVVPCRPTEVRPAWLAGRSRVVVTGRWPIVVAAWDNVDAVTTEAFSRFPYHPFRDAQGVDTSVGGIVRRAADLDAEEILERRLAIDDQPKQPSVYDFLDWELRWTLQAVGDAPSPTEVREALGASPTPAALDKWLLDWEEARGGAAADGTHLQWFEPSGLPTAVLLLPTAVPWESPAFVSFHGADGSGRHEELIAVLRSWNERYGAELVANFGTMLEFVVDRPPSDLDDAWGLAREHDVVAACTLSNVTLRGHARALIGRHEWFLHDRP